MVRKLAFLSCLLLSNSFQRDGWVVCERRHWYRAGTWVPILIQPSMQIHFLSQNARVPQAINGCGPLV